MEKIVCEMAQGPISQTIFSIVIQIRWKIGFNTKTAVPGIVR